jgi:FdhD protein
VALDGQGRVVVAREDVDQANAIDKVIGRLVLDGAWPASGLALFISGRPTASVVHQVWRAGCGALVALGAPTAQAVHLARTGGLTLLSAPGDHGPVVYAPERLGAGVPVRSTDA